MTDAEALILACPHLETLTPPAVVCRAGKGSSVADCVRCVGEANRPVLPPAPPVEDLVARVLRCPHWSPGASCCEGWFCSLNPDEPRRVTIAGDCARCPELPTEA